MYVRNDDMFDRFIYYIYAGIAFIVYCFIGFLKVPGKALKKTRRMLRRELSRQKSAIMNE